VGREADVGAVVVGMMGAWLGPASSAVVSGVLGSRVATAAAASASAAKSW